MTITMICPPHRWDENGAVEGIVLAKCIRCAVRQWHATDGDLDTWAIANKYNKRDHLEIVELKKRRFMDTSLKKDAVSKNPQEGINTPPDPPDITVDSRIQRMRDNRGNSERFDKLAPQVLEDVKTMTWAAALRKAGIPAGSAGRLRRRWGKMGMLSTDDNLPVVTKETPKERDYDAEKEEIIRDYNGLSLKEFYTKQHLNSGKWTELKKKWGIKRKTETKIPRNEPVFAYPIVLNLTSSEITKLTTLGVFSVVKNWLDGTK